MVVKDGINTLIIIAMGSFMNRGGVNSSSLIWRPRWLVRRPGPPPTQGKRKKKISKEKSRKKRTKREKKRNIRKKLDTSNLPGNTQRLNDVLHDKSCCNLFNSLYNSHKWHWKNIDKQFSYAQTSGPRRNVEMDAPASIDASWCA